MVGSKTNNSISSNCSRPPLSKASTQLQLINERVGTVTVRQMSSEAPAGLRSSSSGGTGQWIPDYTLTAITDTTYLKVRRNTYLVAVKASKMENCSNYDEIEEVLVKITENDDDFCGVRSSGVRGDQSARSPDSSWSQVSQVSQVRRDNRRDSVLSTISMIRAKLGAGTRRDTNNSFENIREERFWEIIGNNNDDDDGGQKQVMSKKKVLNRGNTLPGRQSSGDMTLVTRRQTTEKLDTNGDLSETRTETGVFNTPSSSVDKSEASEESPNDKSNLLHDK